MMEKILRVLRGPRGIPDKPYIGRYGYVRFDNLVLKEGSPEYQDLLKKLAYGKAVTGRQKNKGDMLEYSSVGTIREETTSDAYWRGYRDAMRERGRNE